MPNIVYTVAERVEMVRQHEQGLSYRRIADHFAATYPDRPIPSKSTVQKIVTKFISTGNLDPSLIKVSHPNKQLSEEIKLNICLAVEEGLNKPLSKIAEELHISKSSVQKVVKIHKSKRGSRPQKLDNRKKKPAVSLPVSNPNPDVSDFSPLYYSLWSYLKNKLQSEGRIGDLTALWNRVTDVLGDMDPLTISKINSVLDTTPQVKQEISYDSNSSSHS